MHPKEKAILDALQSWRDAEKRYRDRLTLLRKEIRPECTHPPEARMKFDWEHDNGYGVQTTHIGEECQICLKRNMWPRSSNSWTLSSWMEE